MHCNYFAIMSILTPEDTVLFLRLRSTQEDVESLTVHIWKLLCQHRVANESRLGRLLKRYLFSLVLQFLKERDSEVDNFPDFSVDVSVNVVSAGESATVDQVVVQSGDKSFSLSNCLGITIFPPKQTVNTYAANMSFQFIF